MREIKLRGYAVEEMVGSQWIYGTGVHTTKFTKEYAEEVGKHGETFIFTESGWIEVYPESVGEYTGLKDKNDREIYEGDISRAPLEGARNYVVKYDLSKSGFISVTTIENGSEWWMNVSFRHEIVGNIYENPELLEGIS